MDDTYQQTLHGLIRKRGELSTMVQKAREEWEGHVLALEAVDAAIRVFNPAIVPHEILSRKIPPKGSDGHAPIQRFLLEMLRRSGKPVRTLEASAAVMADRGLDPRDRILATMTRKAVGDAFSRLRKAGHVTGAKFGSGTEFEWSLLVCRPPISEKYDVKG